VTERLLTTREVAEMLALSPETVLRRWRAGELPGFRLAPNVLRFRESEVAAWLEERRKGPAGGPAGGASANQHLRRPSGVGYVLRTSTTKEEQ
jgi:excisionase family DNA binding protein